MTLLSFGLTPAETGTSDTVSPSRPVMNKSWSVCVSAEPTDQTTPQGRRRKLLSPVMARNLISTDKIKSLNTASVQTLCLWLNRSSVDFSAPYFTAAHYLLMHTFFLQQLP